MHHSLQLYFEFRKYIRMNKILRLQNFRDDSFLFSVSQKKTMSFLLLRRFISYAQFYCPCAVRCQDNFSDFWHFVVRSIIVSNNKTNKKTYRNCLKEFHLSNNECPFPITIISVMHFSAAIPIAHYCNCFRDSYPFEREREGWWFPRHTYTALQKLNFISC